MGINWYDIYKGSLAGVNVIFATALLGAAVCIQMPPLFSVLNFGLVTLTL